MGSNVLKASIELRSLAVTVGKASASKSPLAIAEPLPN
jgi:hypothetical protein